MLILIDKTTLRMVAAAGSRKWINLVQYVDFPDIDNVIVDGKEGRTWAALTREELAKLYTNMSGQPAPEYSEAITQLAAYAETWPPYPKSERELEIQAEVIFQAEQADRLSDEDVECFPGNPNAGLVSDDEIARDFADESMRRCHQATITMVENANGALSPEQKAEAAAERPKPPEKASRDPNASQARPQQGATKKIWDIADDLLAVHGSVGNIKQFRLEVIYRAKALGLNEGTAATQFGKWKASKGLI